MNKEKLRKRIEMSQHSIEPFYEQDVTEINERFSGAPETWARWRVHTQDDWIFRAILACGSAVRDDCRILLAPLADEVRRANAKNPSALAPNLSILGMINLLQCLGLEPDRQAVDTAAGWLIGIDTANMEPPWWHWERGLAGLAFGQPRVYHPVAGYRHDQPLPFRADADPEFNVQGWIAHFAGALEVGASFQDIEPSWYRFLDVYETLVEVEAIRKVDILWFARVVRHTVGGAPLGEVAEWLHQNLRQFVGLE